MCKVKVLLRKIKSFLKINNKTKLRFMKAYIYTGFARAFILFIPFNKLRKKMGKNRTESAEVVEREIYKLARDIGWAVKQASKYTPWESKCLVQALTVQKMLKERNISSTIYLGVKKGDKNEMLAHAWVRCGEYIITGGVNKHEFTVVARFSN